MSKPVELVMLVDDNDTDNFINKRIIELTGFASSSNIIIKNSGKSALEYLQAEVNNQEKLPNLIFLDINMPIVDGFVFLYEFERYPQQVKDKCKIAILSSSDNKRDIDKIVNNGFVIKFITKPLTEKALNELKEILSKSK
ncbi:MAG: response regulator [Flammeovirgaceae bacterium]